LHYQQSTPPLVGSPPYQTQLAFLFLSWAYENTAQWDKAIDAFQHAGDFHLDPSVLRTAVQVDGARGYWRSRLEFLSRQKMPENFRLVVAHARLGQSDKALADEMKLP
jgi:hypothetical protein